MATWYSLWKFLGFNGNWGASHCVMAIWGNPLKWCEIRIPFIWYVFFIPLSENTFENQVFATRGRVMGVMKRPQKSDQNQLGSSRGSKSLIRAMYPEQILVKILETLIQPLHENTWDIYRTLGSPDPSTHFSPWVFCYLGHPQRPSAPLGAPGRPGGPGRGPISSDVVGLGGGLTDQLNPGVFHLGEGGDGMMGWWQIDWRKGRGWFCSQSDQKKQRVFVKIKW